LKEPITITGLSLQIFICQPIEFPKGVAYTDSISVAKVISKEVRRYCIILNIINFLTWSLTLRVEQGAEENMWIEER
jgi:hypothetical protein